MVTQSPDRPNSGEGGERSRLKEGSLGAPGITFFVVAAAAPLTCVIGITPLMIGFGAGIAAPLVYLVLGAILMLFAVGYVAMSKRVPNPGALYAYIAQGLGRTMGVGAALVSLLAYIVALITLSAFFGYAVSGLLFELFGLDVPWILGCLVGVAVTMLLGHRQISVGAKVLAGLLVAEVTVLLVLAIAILVRGGAEGLTIEPFNPAGLLSGGIGVSLAFAYASYVGFEQTAIYAEEAKDRARSVKRATYAAVILTSVFYAVITWTIILAVGSTGVVDVAASTPGSLIVDITDDYLGRAAVTVISILVVTSSFAAILSFHNATARYMYALGRERILPRALGRTHPVTVAPYRASVVVGVVNAVALLMFFLAGVDPYLGVFSWGAAASAVGFILLQAICAIAVVGFFRRQDTGGEGVWTTRISPVLAFIGLGTVLVLVISNFSALVGVDVGLLALIVPVAYLVVAVLGLLYGDVLRRRRPEVWQKVGYGGLPDPVHDAEVLVPERD